MSALIFSSIAHTNPYENWDIRGGNDATYLSTAPKICSPDFEIKSNQIINVAILK